MHAPVNSCVRNVAEDAAPRHGTSAETIRLDDYRQVCRRDASRLFWMAFGGHRTAEESFLAAARITGISPDTWRRLASRQTDARMTYVRILARLAIDAGADCEDVTRMVLGRVR